MIEPKSADRLGSIIRVWLFQSAPSAGDRVCSLLPPGSAAAAFAVEGGGLQVAVYDHLVAQHALNKTARARPPAGAGRSVAGVTDKQLRAPRPGDGEVVRRRAEVEKQSTAGRGPAARLARPPRRPRPPENTIRIKRTRPAPVTRNGLVQPESCVGCCDTELSELGGLGCIECSQTFGNGKLSVNLFVAELINLNSSQHARPREDKHAIDARLFVAAQKITDDLKTYSCRRFFATNREINARTATGTSSDDGRCFKLRKKPFSFCFRRVAMLDDPARHGPLSFGERPRWIETVARFHLFFA